MKGETLPVDFPALPSEISLYCGLCVLATYDRADLSKILDTGSFRNMLDLEPVVRTAVFAFHGANYTELVGALNQIDSVVPYDPFLHSQARAILPRIRSRALVQYTSPYSVVSLAAIAQDFSTTIEAVEAELMELITSKQVKGRIDSHEKTLVSRDEDASHASLAAVLGAAESYVSSTRLALLRASVIEAGLTVKMRDGDKQQQQQQQQQPLGDFRDPMALDMDIDRYTRGRG